MSKTLRSRSNRIWLRLRVYRVLALAALAAGCSPGSRQPILTVGEVAGTLVSTSAGSLTFLPDHRFMARNLDLSGDFGSKCQTTAYTRGTWEFDGPNGKSGDSLTEFNRGNLVFLNEEYSSSPSQDSCANAWDMPILTTWQVNGPLGLCASSDPDSPCDGEPFVWRRKN